MAANRIPLTELSLKLADKFGESIGYRALYMAALDGKIPAQRVSGRWYVVDADLDHIAATFGLNGRKLASRGRARIAEPVAA